MTNKLIRDLDQIEIMLISDLLKEREHTRWFKALSLLDQLRYKELQKVFSREVQTRPLVKE